MGKILVFQEQLLVVTGILSKNTKSKQLPFQKNLNRG